jgi:hypothetical protein
LIGQSYFFVFLSENVITYKEPKKTVFTQNWVNFELGCVYAQKKEKKKFIYVFEPFQQLHFPIPYLDYYVLINPNYEPHWDYVEELFTLEADFDREITKSWNPLTKIFTALKQLRGHQLQRPSDRYGFEIYHRECGAKYTSACYEVLASSVATETAMKRIINNVIAVNKLSICLSNANIIKVPIIEMTILHLIAIFPSPLIFIFNS